MTNRDILKYTDENGYTFTGQAWIILGMIDNLSDRDKADFATAVIDMIADDAEGRDLVLNIYNQRCKHCGKRLDGESCHCWNDE